MVLGIRVCRALKLSVRLLIILILVAEHGSRQRLKVLRRVFLTRPNLLIALGCLSRRLLLAREDQVILRAPE